MATTAAPDSLLEASPKESGLSPSRLANLGRVTHEAVDASKVAGAIALVGRHSKVVYQDVYGSMDREAGKPMALDTIFRIYSMTKPIASVALMMLYEEGRFQLDDAASRYIPEFEDQRVLAGGSTEQPDLREPLRPATVRDHLMHTAGLPGLGRLPESPIAALYREAALPGITAQGATLRDLIVKLGQLPLAYDPGTRWEYGASTDVVAYLVEVLSGQRFDEFLRQRIFEPLGMIDTGFHVPASELQRFAANYRAGENGLELADAPATSAFARPQTYFSGVGGLVSTAADYTRFCKMLANGGELDGERILGPRTLQLMATNHLAGGRDMKEMGGGSRIARPGMGFGLGFAVLLDPAAAGVIGTPGEYYWSGAANTAFFVNPAEDLFVILLTQVMTNPQVDGSISQQMQRQMRVIAYTAIID
jgi:CubicO group peptidase (beta-lactamase class C family)